MHVLDFNYYFHFLERDRFQRKRMNSHLNLDSNIKFLNSINKLSLYNACREKQEPIDYILHFT